MPKPPNHNQNLHKKKKEIKPKPLIVKDNNFMPTLDDDEKEWVIITKDEANKGNER